jgi:hypothetical protein
MRHPDQPEGDPHYDENRFYMSHANGNDGIGEVCSRIFPDEIQMLEICSLSCWTRQIKRNFSDHRPGGDSPLFKKKS